MSNATTKFNKRRPFTITGIVEWMGDEQVLGAKGFRKREIVLCDDPQKDYPDYTLIEFAKEKCDLLADVRKGDEVTLEFFTEARWWEPKDKSKKGRWFGSLRGWSLKVSGAAEPQEAETAQASAPQPAENGPGDELPF